MWQCIDHRRTGNALCWDEQAGHLHYVEQQRGKNAALWKVILLSAPSAAFANEVHKKGPFDNMFWISSVSITSCGISKNFLVRIMLFTPIPTACQG